MRRLAPVTRETMTPEQADLFDNITGGLRGADRPLADFVDAEGGLRGPFNPLMYAPAIGDAAQRLGEMLRFRSKLSGPVREVAILTVGQYWQADYEFWAHARIAGKEGVSEADIEALRQGRAPAAADLAQIHAFVREMLENRKIGDATYAATQALLGDEGMVELVLLAGYYGLVSANLNVFRAAMPEGEDAPFGTV